MWLWLLSAFALIFAQEPDADHSDAGQPAWLPVGLQVSDLGVLYTAEKADDEEMVPITGNVLNLNDCANIMNQLSFLPKFAMDELMRAMDNATNYGELVGFMDDEDGNVTTNHTENGDPDYGTDFPDEDQGEGSVFMTNEALYDSTQNFYNEEMSNQLLQELASGQQGEIDQHELQRSFNAVSQMRTYFSHRCSYACVPGYCGFIIRDCTHPGTACRWRRCRPRCIACTHANSFCVRRQNMLFGNIRYACHALSARPKLYSNTIGSLRCHC
ncbi:hypothetical protein SK128_002009 [Halocaridina rubra]|uniref:Uncharacterized protein n=1 Tax=Halocaridina rubra TaxID=373956 RepID=A0AAN8WC45_HALRR